MQTVDRTEFISAMRNVASSVSVVTTNGPAGRHGATGSAFCSVSADPPTVLVCLNAGSKIADCVKQNGLFRLNVLPDGASGIANRFAGLDDADVTDRFDGMPVWGDVPCISGATSLACKVRQTTQEATHLICIGRVTEVTLGADLPLTYLAGRYHRLTQSEALQ